MPSPCQRLQYACTPRAPLQIKTLTAGDAKPGGWDALGAVGDVLLSNDRVSVVIAGLGNQNYLDPNGGSILDLSNLGKNDDGLNQILTAVGILPRDALNYTQIELIDESPERVAVQLRGTLFEQPNVPVATLYELRPCEPGVRVRTEVVNGTLDTQLWGTTDAFYWSDREPLAFAAGGPGLGFDSPEFTLTTLNDAYRRFAFLAATPVVQPSASYGSVACERKALEGFNNDFLSAAGMPKQVIPPRGYQVFERVLFPGPGADVASAGDVAFDLRKALFGEAFVTVQGTVVQTVPGALERPNVASILISEGQESDPPASRIPWAQVFPDNDGVFSARVPLGKRLMVDVHALGRSAVVRNVGALTTNASLGEFVLPSTGTLDVQVRDASLAPIDAELFLVPADDSTAEAVIGAFHNRAVRCAPYLGAAHGPSPACNRVLVHQGRVQFEALSGNYDVYAFKGLFWTMAKQRVALTSQGSVLTLVLEKLSDLQPPGTLTADLHVHGARSFDSSLPDFDRVLSFAATDLQVIAATDHEVAYDYSDVIQQMGYQNVMSAIPGTETTAHIPFLKVPGDEFPRVIGHYNFWPVAYDRTQPRFGGAFDEFIEPGELFDRFASRFTSEVPVIQLNHPWGAGYFGRDIGFPRAIHLDLNLPPPSEDDGTAQGVYVRSPRGGARNNAHHAQEVMNGTDLPSFIQDRAVWFWTLNAGQLKAGTANSDSHGLTDNTVGVPRNVVFTSTSVGPTFRVAVFNQSVREGRVLGTNGPLIRAELDTDNGPVPYGLALVKPALGAQVHVEVTAAPWVPVEEIRFIVNGKLAKRLGPESLAPQGDPFATPSTLVRYSGTVPLSELVTTSARDAWLVVEAGAPLPDNKDLGGGLTTREFPAGAPDGVPDTGDNNGDGVIDTRDIAEGEAIGPLARPPLPTHRDDPRFPFAQVVTGGFPMAFTNPFILDLNGNGQFDAPGVQR